MTGEITNYCADCGEALAGRPCGTAHAWLLMRYALERFPQPVAREGTMADDKGLDTGRTRVFDSGASRDTAGGKYDYEGFMSPLAVRRFGEYMYANRTMRDGSVRESDNWQKGIPLDEYMKSMWRHFLDVWLYHRGQGRLAVAMHIEDALCAIIFNAQGYLHEVLKERPLEKVPEQIRCKYLYRSRPGLAFKCLSLSGHPGPHQFTPMGEECGVRHTPGVSGPFSSCQLPKGHAGSHCQIFGNHLEEWGM